MKKITIFLFLLLAVSATAEAQRQRQARPPSVIILKNVNLVDVENKQILPSMDIAIEGGLIREIGKNIQPANPTDTVIDLTGKYAVPGLIDVHTHIANSQGTGRQNLTEQLRFLVEHGITSVRDVGSDARQLAELMRAVNTNEIIGPDIFYAAFIATNAYYEHGNRNPSAAWTAGLEENFAPWVQLVEPGAELDAVMIAAKATGATGLKVYLGYDKDFLAEIVTAARKQGLQLWAHTMLYPAKPHEVAAAGVDVMSHVSMLENEAFEGVITHFEQGNAQKATLDMLNINLDKFIENALKNDVILDATLRVSVPNFNERHSEKHQPLYNMLNQVYKAGVKIAAGSDWFITPGWGDPPLFEELVLLVEHGGLSTMDAIRAATIIAAETFKGQNQKGSITQGKDADIVILNANPVEDIKNLQNNHLVMKKGRLIPKRN